jgi:hypothetical protein
MVGKPDSGSEKTAQGCGPDILKTASRPGEWTTYDASGKVVKVTTMKSPR